MLGPLILASIIGPTWAILFVLAEATGNSDSNREWRAFKQMERARKNAERLRKGPDNSLKVWQFVLIILFVVMPVVSGILAGIAWAIE